MIDAALFQAIVHTLGWTLVHFLWQGLLLWGVFALCMLILRNASAAARYWAGMATLAAMGIAPVLTFIGLYDAADQAAAGLAAAGGVARIASAADDWTAWAGRIEVLLPWLVTAWLAGVGLLSWRLAAEYRRIRRLVLGDVTPLSREWQQIVEDLRVTLGVCQAVRIMISAHVSVPMVVGWFRPLILIPPSAMLGLTPRQLELIISHELAHVKRFDYLFNWLQIVIETLLFYHPAVRSVSLRVRQEREHCCDDLVVHHTGDRVAYARALTEVADLRCSAGMQVAMAATGGRLMGRVRRIVAMPGPQRGSAYWSMGLVCIAVLAAGTMRHLPELGAAAPVELPRIAAVATPSVVPEPAAPVAQPPQAEPAPPGDRHEALIGGRAVPRDGTTAAVSSPSPAAATAADVPARESDENAAPAPPARTEPPSAVAPEPPVRTAAASPPDASPRDSAPAVPALPAPEPPAQIAAPPDTAEPLRRERLGSESMAARPAPDLRAPSEPASVPEASAPPPNTGPPVSADPAAPAPVPAIGDAPEPVAPAAEEHPAPPEIEPVLTGGTLLKSVAPSYPRRARLQGVEGSVTVRYVVDTKGRVRNVETIESVAGRYFERPVHKALKRWRYEPFAKDGAPVRRTIERTFDFGMQREMLPSEVQVAQAAAGPCQKITGTRICRSDRNYEDLAVTVVGNTP